MYSGAAATIDLSDVVLVEVLVKVDDFVKVVVEVSLEEGFFVVDVLFKLDDFEEADTPLPVQPD